MAAPASSAPPKKVVAPTVSQINAEYVTQVGLAAERPVPRLEPGATGPRCLSSFCRPWVLGKRSCSVVRDVTPALHGGVCVPSGSIVERFT